MVSIYIVLVALLTIVFFLRMAADMLTPHGIRTFFYSKLVLAALLMVIYLELILFSRGRVSGMGRVGGLEIEFLLFFTGLFALYFFALFWGGQVNTHNAKRQKDLVLGDGYTPTLIYVTVLTFNISFSVDINLSDKKAFWFGLYCVSYYTFFSGLARMLRRRFLKPDKRTVLVYIILLLVLIGFNGMITLIHGSLIGDFTMLLKTPDTVITPPAILAFMPLAFISSWKLTQDVVGLWMLLPLLIGLFAAWLGREETTKP